MGLRLTSAADYAVRAMIHLACLADGGVALRSEIAEAQYIPTSFMAKILRSLVRARLLRSSRGVNGGFSLERPADSISMLDVIEAVEGRSGNANCLLCQTRCDAKDEDPISSLWHQAHERMVSVLRSSTLAEVADNGSHRARAHARLTARPRI